LISKLSGLIGLVDLVTKKSLRSDHAIPSKTEAGSSGSNELQPPLKLPLFSGTPFAYLKSSSEVPRDRLSGLKSDKKDILHQVNRHHKNL
jgi:hypothetical protein